jgi:two-component system, cell cycle response regulator
MTQETDLFRRAAAGWSEDLPAAAGRRADAEGLNRLIDRLALDGADPFACAVEELVRLLDGDRAIHLMAEGGGYRAAGGVSSGWAELDLRDFPALTAAIGRAELATVPAPAAFAADGSERAGGSSWLTAVPVLADGQAVGCVLVRTAAAPLLDPVRVETALLIGRITHGFAGRRAAESRRAEPVAVSPMVTPLWGLPAVGAADLHTVVVVEDDPDVADGLKRALETEGYAVTVAARAQEALSILRASPPSLVILDVSLPDGDGFSIAQALAAQRRTAYIPILFLSAATDLATRVRSLHREEADFLRKPFAWKELLTRVEQCVLRGERRQQLRASARMDELTGVGNRRLLEERLAAEAARIDRYGTPLSIVVLDVDGLKTINDRHGHAAGSAVLRAVGEALRGTVRETDLAARYGGDEFVVLLPHTELDQAVAFADRVLGRLRPLRPGGLKVSVSIGVAGYDVRRDASVEGLFERADQSAYQAKRAGGDRVHVDPGG